MAVNDGRIQAVGDNLHRLDEFAAYQQIDLKKKPVFPGFVDAHTHFFFFALSLGRVNLNGLTSLRRCLDEIRGYSASIPRGQWVVGEGYTPDLFATREEPDRFQLDEVTGGRPAFIFSHDQHSAWVNSRALEIAGIGPRTGDPRGGEIVRFADGIPTGILREGPAMHRVFQHIAAPPKSRIDRLYRQALAYAYANGVTGVHSFDGADGFSYFSELAVKGKLGLRINYYPQAEYLPDLRKTGTRYGTGDPYLRIAGIKIFADGSLGSRTALCFHTYKDSRTNRGIEVTPVKKIIAHARSAARLGLPCAVHAIGDRAVANVLDAFESVPRPKHPARHRLEHLQLTRRKDLVRFRKLGVVASMQPQQLLSDIDMMRRYWGPRARNAYLFRTVLDRGIPLAFGSDAPIESLTPLAGIAAAVRRARPGSRDVFFAEERITAEQAVYAYTAGPAQACGQADCRGLLLPGYPADFVVLSQDITRIAPMRITDTRVLATVLDGSVTYCAERFSL